MQKWLTLFSMGVMILIDNIDTSAVNLAIPYIAKDLLLLNNNSLAWISNGYLKIITICNIDVKLLTKKYWNLNNEKANLASRITYKEIVKKHLIFR